MPPLLAESALQIALNSRRTPLESAAFRKGRLLDAGDKLVDRRWKRDEAICLSFGHAISSDGTRIAIHGIWFTSIQCSEDVSPTNACTLLFSKRYNLLGSTRL